MMCRKSFLEIRQPFLCGIVIEDDPAKMIAGIRNSEYDGASAVALHTRHLPAASKTVEGYRAILTHANVPTLVIHYREGDLFTDDECGNFLLNAAHAGASIVDVMGDLYCPSVHELTLDKDAVKRQKDLINQLHEIGAAVIMSSHTKDFLSKEQVLSHMLEMQQRGVDMVKIVYSTDTQEQLEDAICATSLLRKELDVPFLHLCNGKYGMTQRYIAPLLGSVLSFGSHEFIPNGHAYQIPLHSFKHLYDEMYSHASVKKLTECK